VIVYDLRYSPIKFIGMSQKDLAKTINANWKDRQADDYVGVPVKELQYNRSPAIAPVSVLLQNDGWGRIGLKEVDIKKHRDELLAHPEFAENIRSIFESRDDFAKSTDPECQLYDSFVPDIDRMRAEKVRSLDATGLADFQPNFADERLAPLLLHYKARSYPTSLSEAEAFEWENWRGQKIKKALPSYIKSLEKLSVNARNNKTLFLLQELHLWAESVMPNEDDQLSLVD